jgi:N-acetylneuraminate synthase
LQRVIDLTQTIKTYFTRATRPLVVVSVGGFTEDQPLKTTEREALYQLVAKSLSELHSEDVEILPQTLPPFPWYFGGQRFSNIFVDSEDTVKFCQDYGYRVCLDISHSALTANHRKIRLGDFVKQVGPYVGHLHIVDASGVDGEGLQIGDGDIDFPELSRLLASAAPAASFIPEIWQGHHNDGAGFWIALDRLEPWF